MFPFSLHSQHKPAEEKGEENQTQISQLQEQIQHLESQLASTREIDDEALSRKNMELQERINEFESQVDVMTVKFAAAEDLMQKDASETVKEYLGNVPADVSCYYELLM
jgi:SMC interacting uncharacterized protein involved in chromosome segregation